MININDSKSEPQPPPLPVLPAGVNRSEPHKPQDNFVPCPFNSDHLVPRKYLDTHKTQCMDRPAVRRIDPPVHALAISGIDVVPQQQAQPSVVPIPVIPKSLPSSPKQNMAADEVLIPLAPNHFTYINQDSDSDDDLSCPVCMDIFIDPVDHSTCGVTLCLVCCDELKNTNQACPSCREPLNNVNPNRSMKKIADKRKVACNDCKTQMKRSDFQRHYHYVCLISCPQQCDIKTLTRQDRDAHVREQCPETLSICPYGCQQTVPRKLLGEHDATCESYIVSCIRCDARLARRDAAAHDPLCPEMMVACPHCSSQHTRRQLSAHIQSCDASPSQCSASQFCDWKGTRGDLLAHAQDCLYAKLGPYFQAQESRMSQQASRIQELEAKSEEQRDRFTKELNEARRANQQNVLAYERRLAEQDSQVSFLLSSVLKLNTQLNESKLKQMTSQRKVSISEFKSEQKHNIHFPLCDLTGLQLAGADLTQGYFWNSVFINMDLSGTILTGAELGNANLSGANLTGANLTGANLSNTTLSGANLSNADLTGATLFHGHRVGETYRMKWGTAQRASVLSCRLEGYGNNNSVFRVKRVADGMVKNDCEPSWFLS